MFPRMDDFQRNGLDPDQEARLPSSLWHREERLDRETCLELLELLRDGVQPAASHLWVPGDELHDELVLLTGTVRMFLRDPKGREWNTHLLAGPCFLPPLHLRTRSGRATQRTECLSDCSIQRIDVASFCRMRERNPTLMRLGLRLVDEELDRLRIREESLLGLDLPERVARLLETHPEIWRTFRRKDIASYLHASPEALSRALPRVLSVS